MSTQKKVTAKLQEIADNLGVDLVNNRQWANTGVFSFQPTDGFVPILEFSYDFQTNDASFGNVHEHIGDCPDHGQGWWHLCKGRRLDEFIERVGVYVEESLHGSPTEAKEG